MVVSLMDTEVYVREGTEQGGGVEGGGRREEGGGSRREEEGGGRRREEGEGGRRTEKKKGGRRRRGGGMREKEMHIYNHRENYGGWEGSSIVNFHYTPYHCLFPFCIFPLHICIFPLHISILHIPLQLTAHAQYVIAS